MATKQKTYKLIEGAANIDKAITSLQRRGKKFDEDTHICALSCKAHMDKHGDYTLAVKLIAGMPKSARKHALQDWFLHFTKMKYDVQSKKFGYDRNKVSLPIEEATATPFWSLVASEGGAYKPFNLQDRVQRLLKDIERAVAKGDTVAPEAIETLKGLLEPVEEKQAA